jgi:2-polyprenyl-6-methoxyphenol hydroxylase-like FAD-dependent oxidoreductase
LIEQAQTPHRQTRATVLQSATQELLWSAGLWDAFAAVAQPIRRSQLLLDDGRVLEERVDAVDSPFPAQLSLPQWRTEALLAERLLQLGGRIERGVVLQRVDEEGEGLRLVLQHRDGIRETLRVRYLIDASGSHSLTRASMREELEGETYAGHYLVADLVLRQPPEAVASYCAVVFIKVQRRMEIIAASVHTSVAELQQQVAGKARELASLTTRAAESELATARAALAAAAPGSQEATEAEEALRTLRERYASTLAAAEGLAVEAASSLHGALRVAQGLSQNAHITHMTAGPVVPAPAVGVAG